MKKANILSIVIMLMMLGAFTMAGQAQNRGKGNNKGKGNKKHAHVHDHHHHDYHHHRTTRVVRPVRAHQHVVTHPHERPRYVYYSDYGVYHDVQKNVYFTYNGRKWTVSATLPVVLHRVDVRRASTMAVDFYADDFVEYLHHSRPIYAGVYVRR